MNTLIANTNIHDVVSVGISYEDSSNSNAKTIQITTRQGFVLELTLFGETDDLENLPKSNVFRQHQ